MEYGELTEVSSVVGGKLQSWDLKPGLPLGQHSPNFLAPGTGLMEDDFSTDQQWGMVWDVSCTLHLLCTVFLL